MIRNAIDKLRDTFSTKKSEAKELGEMFFDNDFAEFFNWWVMDKQGKQVDKQSTKSNNYKNVTTVE